jgi:hypothetical protein
MRLGYEGKNYKETFESGGYVPYFYFGDGFIGTVIPENSPNCMP